MTSTDLALEIKLPERRDVHGYMGKPVENCLELTLAISYSSLGIGFIETALFLDSWDG